MTSIAYKQSGAAEPDLRCYLNPSLARNLEQTSTERSLASLALRNIWHVLFDPCPGTLALSPPDGKALLESFLDWAELEDLSMSWGLHMHVLDWLCRHSRWTHRLNDDIVKELMVAGALRWAQSNMSDLAHIGAKTIILRSASLTDVAVGARRGRTPNTHPSVHLLRLPGLTHTGKGLCGYGYKNDAWAVDAWHPIPR